MSIIKIEVIDPYKGTLNVVEGSTVPLTFGIADIRDFSKRSGAKSKDTRVAGDNDANKLFGSIYEANVSTRKFNPNISVKVNIIEDGNVVAPNMYMQLKSIDRTPETQTQQAGIEYVVTFKDDISNFFDALNNKELADNSYQDMNHELTAFNIIKTFTYDYTNGYKYFLPYTDNTNTLYTLDKFKPAIFGKTYLDRIVEGAGYSYDWSEFSASTVQFDKVLHPYNGGTVQLVPGELEEYFVRAESTFAETKNLYFPQSAQTANATFNTNINTEIQDLGNLYNPAVSVYTNVMYIPNQQGTIQFKYNIDYELIVDNLSAVTAYKTGVTTNANWSAQQGGKLKVTPQLRLMRQQQSPGGFAFTQASQNFCNPVILPPEINAGSTNLITGSTQVILNATGNILPNNAFSALTAIIVEQQTVGQSITQYKYNTLPGAPLAKLNFRLKINSIKLEVNPQISNGLFNGVMNMDKYVPQKIKQQSYVASIFQMYNLYLLTDKLDSKKLIFKHRDEYYDSGKRVVWTKKFLKNLPNQKIPLGLVQKKKVQFTYKQDEKDEKMKQYFEAIKEPYGFVEYEFDSQHVKDVDKKEVMFSPVIPMINSYGDVLPTGVGAAPENNMKVALNAMQQIGGGTYTVQNYVGNGLTIQDVWGTNFVPLISHWNRKENPFFDLNFGVNDYYFYNDFGQWTNNTLYNLHWRRTISQINSGHMLIGMFQLNSNDISKMELNDIIEIDNELYSINQILDYKAGSNEPTKVELISIDSSLVLPPFKNYKRPGFPSMPAVPAGPLLPAIGGPIRPVKEAADKVVYFNNNIFADVSNVMGASNVVQKRANNSFISGDDNDVSEKSMINGDNNKSLAPSTIFGRDNYVDSGAVDAIVMGNGITASTPNTVYTSNLEVQGNFNGIPVETLTAATAGNFCISGITTDDIYGCTNSGNTIDFDYLFSTYPGIKIESAVPDSRTFINNDPELFRVGTINNVTSDLSLFSISTLGFVQINNVGSEIGRVDIQFDNISNIVEDGGSRFQTLQKYNEWFSVINSSQTAMTINSNGVKPFTSGNASVVGLGLDIDGYIVTASTFNGSDYLPLSGGTMSGDIELPDGVLIKNSAYSPFTFITLDSDELNIAGNTGTTIGSKNGDINIQSRTGTFIDASPFGEIYIGQSDSLGINIGNDTFGSSEIRLISDIDSNITMKNGSGYTAYLDKLSINSFGSGTSISNLGLDSDGFVVTSSTISNDFCSTGILTPSISACTNDSFISFDYFGGEAVYASSPDGLGGESIMLLRDEQAYLGSSDGVELRLGGFGGGLYGAKLSTGFGGGEIFINQNESSINFTAERYKFDIFSDWSGSPIYNLGIDSNGYLVTGSTALNNNFCASGLTTSAISACTGNALLDLDYDGTPNTILLETTGSNDVTNTFMFDPENNFLGTYWGATDNGTSETSLISMYPSILNMSSDGQVRITSEIVNIQGEGLLIKNNSFAPVTSSSFAAKTPAFVSSQNSKIETLVRNTVILGGVGITANTSNSVYVPKLNVGTLTGTSISLLGVDSNGFVVTASTVVNNNFCGTGLITDTISACTTAVTITASANVQGALTATKSFTDASDVGIVSEGVIPGMNLRSGSNGSLSILTNYFANDSTSFITGTGSNIPSSTARIHIDHVFGNVGFGNSSPAQKVDVTGNVKANSFVIANVPALDNAATKVLSRNTSTGFIEEFALSALTQSNDFCADGLKTDLISGCTFPTGIDMGFMGTQAIALYNDPTFQDGAIGIFPNSTIVGSYAPGVGNVQIESSKTIKIGTVGSVTEDIEIFSTSGLTINSLTYANQDVSLVQGTAKLTSDSNINTGNGIVFGSGGQMNRMDINQSTDANEYNTSISMRPLAGDITIYANESITSNAEASLSVNSTSGSTTARLRAQDDADQVAVDLDLNSVQVVLQTYQDSTGNVGSFTLNPLDANLITQQSINLSTVNTQITLDGNNDEINATGAFTSFFATNMFAINPGVGGYKLPLTGGTLGQVLQITNTGSTPVEAGWVTPAAGVSKYTTSTNLGSGNNTITHSLGTQFVTVQLYTSAGVMVIPNSVTLTNTTQVTINLTTAMSSARVVIIG